MKKSNDLTTPQACELIEQISKQPIDQNYFTSLCRREYFIKSRQIGGKRGPWLHDKTEIVRFAQKYTIPPLGRPKKDARPLAKTVKRDASYRLRAKA